MEETNNRFDEPVVYGVKNIDDEERLSSQSGGMFSLLADVVLNHQGLVYGCVFDEHFDAVHARAETIVQKNRMRNSKYVQSKIGDIYKLILADLLDDRTVLFSGTACQVAGLKQYIKLNERKVKGRLITVDILCHGVPSPRVWRDYLNWESKKNRSLITNVVCRNKAKFGWKSHITTISFKNGKEYDSRVFPRLFYSHMALRPSCYACPYKNTHHISDLTIGDFWGIDHAIPGFKDELGVSLVLINTRLGESLFKLCEGNIISHPADIKDCLQKPLVEPYARPDERDQFWKLYNTENFSVVAKKYGNNNMLFNIKWKIKYLIKKRHLSSEK